MICWRTLLIALLLLPVLSSCVVGSYQPAYPEKWEPQEAVVETEKCPMLAGLYEERGEAPNDCVGWMEACRSLSYNLFIGNIGYKEIWDESTEPRFPIGTHVEIRQPSNDMLEIIQWQLGNNQEQVVGKKTLLMANGDFSCDEDGLSLKPRSVYYLVGLSNLLGTVSMNFSTSKDGSLIMKSKFSYIGHHVFVPGAHSVGAWVRWRAASREEAVNATIMHTIEAGYAEIAGLTHEQLRVQAELGNPEAQLQLYWLPEEPQRLKWLCRASDQGHADAQYRLGLLYQYGNEGVPLDSVRAYMWYRLAASNGHHPASADAQALLDDLTAGQAMEAEMLLQKWKPGRCELELVSDNVGD